ncbi:MAG: hypothetical protein ChlgKO_03890 [Chlamydiales bacterium]
MFLRGIYNQASQNLVRKYSTRHVLGLPRLPVLESVLAKARRDGFRFNRTAVISTKHMLYTNYINWAQQIKLLGLRPENEKVHGICCSNDFEVIEMVRALGIEVADSSTTFTNKIPYDDLLESLVGKWLIHSLQTINWSEVDQLILYDNGGKLLVQFNELLQKAKKGEFPEGVPEEVFAKIKVVGIAHTRSTFYFLEEKTMHFPIVDMARHRIKVLYESKFIAADTARTAREIMKKTDHYASNILLYGGGRIAEELEPKLRSFFPGNIEVFDLQYERSDFPLEYLEEKLQESRIIIDATGRRPKKDFLSLMLPGTTLLNASSSNRSFNIDRNIEKLEEYDDYRISPVIGNGVIAQWSGFPINLARTVGDEQYITKGLRTNSEVHQVTRALEIAAKITSLQLFARIKPVLQNEENGCFAISYPYTQLIKCEMLLNYGSSLG